MFLPEKQVDVLILLAARAGEIVSKAALTEAAWHDIAVTDNSLVQAVAGLRRTLGNQDNGIPYIQTILRRGYRFLARCGVRIHAKRHGAGSGGVGGGQSLRS